MKELVKSPLSIDHYAFMKKFLDDDMQPHLKSLSDEEASKADRGIALDAINKKLKQELEALNAQLEAAKDDAASKVLLEANIQKLKNVMDTLSNPDKKNDYDLALKKSKVDTSISIQVGSKGISVVALVPLNDIATAFEEFVAKQKKGWPSLNGKPFPEGSFKCERISGPPEMLRLTFPDIESAKAFIQQLFESNMAMFPGGSQDINEFDEQLEAQQKQQQEAAPISSTSASQDSMKKFKTVVGDLKEEGEKRTPGNAPNLGSGNSA